MTERTIIAVVSEFRATGLTVEQQILMDELVMLTASLQAQADLARERRKANRERMERVRAHKRCVPHTETQKEKAPIPPKEKLYNNIKPPKPPFAAEPLFDEFWRVYPLKVGKGAALKAFRHANSRASAEEIIAGARRYAADSKRDQKFTKHPSTWLNADCWLDEADVGWKPPIVLDAPRRTYAEIKAEKEAKQ